MLTHPKDRNPPLSVCRLRASLGRDQSFYLLGGAGLPDRGSFHSFPEARQLDYHHNPSDVGHDCYTF